MGIKKLTYKVTVLFIRCHVIRDVLYQENLPNFESTIDVFHTTLFTKIKYVLLEQATNLKDGEEARLPTSSVSHDDELEAILQNCGVIICV